MRLSRFRNGALLGMLILGLAEAGCTQSASNVQTLAKFPADYRDRHPILLTRSSSSSNLEVGAHSSGLSGLQHAEIEGLARNFRSDGDGHLVISTPSGTVNETAAARASREARGILVSEGIPPHAISMRTYKADTGVLAPPVVFSYSRLRAVVPHKCHLNDDIDTDIQNRDYGSFGCSTQTNLAAMVANPNDLTSPRSLDSPYSPRRYTVLEKFGKGEDTTTKHDNQNAGSVNKVGQ